MDRHGLERAACYVMVPSQKRRRRRPFILDSTHPVTGVVQTAYLRLAVFDFCHRLARLRLLALCFEFKSEI